MEAQETAAQSGSSGRAARMGLVGVLGQPRCHLLDLVHLCGDDLFTSFWMIHLVCPKLVCFVVDLINAFEGRPHACAGLMDVVRGHIWAFPFLMDHQTSP